MNDGLKAALIAATGAMLHCTPAAAEVSIQGFPAAGTTTWTVFSCVAPLQAPICVVPVKVGHLSGTVCRFEVADVIEFDSSKTFRIHWQLRSTDPTPNRRFRFGHSQGILKEGITFNQDFDGDFRNEPLGVGDKFGKQLRRFQALDRLKLFTYDLNVEFLDSVGGQPTPCDSKGPIIINRG